MSAEENKALVRETYEEIMNRGNISAIGKAFAPDFVGHGPSYPQPFSGHAAITEYVTAWLSAFPDGRITIDDQVAEGDRVVTRYTCTGTHKGEFMGIGPTGKQITFAGVAIDRISQGRIAEEWAVDDALGMMQQLGVIPRPGETGIG